MGVLFQATVGPPRSVVQRAGKSWEITMPSEECADLHMQAFDVSASVSMHVLGYRGYSYRYVATSIKR